MKNSHYNPNKEHFRQNFDDSQANYSESQQGRPPQHLTGKPIQLLRIEPNGKISINNDALDIIAAYNQPVGFVSLVGKTRTGKSCLLNRLLNIKGTGFRVDSSTSSCTEGIWMWSDPFRNTKYNNLIFFLDTQGTDSLVKNTDNDTKIFTLTVLISSFFIYNSMGCIDQRSLSQIQMVTALSKKIKTGEQSSSPSELSRFMPKFLWLLRDFMLQLKDEHFNTITSNQYLQNNLATNSASQQSHKIKKSIISYFPIRECQILVRPVYQENAIYNLNELQDYKIRRQFIQGVNQLRNKIINNTNAKVYGGAQITGYAMSVMIQNYVDTFNNGGIPNIRSAWQQISADQGIQAYNKAIQLFQAMVQNQLGHQQPRGQEIYRIVGKIRNETLNKFKDEVGQNIRQHRQHQSKLQAFIDQNQQTILQQNQELCIKFNNNLIYTHSQKIRKRIQTNHYANVNGKQQLKNDIQEIKDNYTKQSIGTSKGQVLTQFMAAITPMLMSIKTQDENQQEQLKRQMERQKQEYQRKLKLQKDKNISKQNQVKSKDRAQDLKNSKILKKPTSAKDDARNKKKSGGCCGTDCQLM